MLDPLDTFTIKTESEHDSNLTHNLDNNIHHSSSTEITQESCHAYEHNGERVGEVEEHHEYCFDTNVGVKEEFIEADNDPLEANLDDDPLAHPESDPLSVNNDTLPKKSKYNNRLGKRKNCKILVDPSTKFSIADIFAHCKGDPNITPENIVLEEEYNNFKKSKNTQFSAFLKFASKKLRESPSNCREKGNEEYGNCPEKGNEESGNCPEKGNEKPEIVVSGLSHDLRARSGQTEVRNIKEEVVDGVDRGPKDVCPGCVNFQSTERLNRLWFKSDTGEYCCKLCLGRYPSITQLKAHLDTHGTCQYKCQQCTQSFSCKACLSNHIDQDHESALYTCHHCKKEFPNKPKLIKHVNAIHEGKTYTCAHCMKTLPNKLNLRYHLSRHEGTLFYCSICPKYYYAKESLKVHIFSHTANFDQKMSYYTTRMKCRLCPQSFAKESTLEKHMRDCGKRLPCEYCDKTFSSTHNRKHHMNAQHRGKKHSCPYCAQQFRYSQYVKLHVQVKHRGIKFKCKFCDKECSTSGNLDRHMRSTCEKITVKIKPEMF